MPNNDPPIVACPHCGALHAWDVNNKARPFCSERCKLVDLGKWAAEDYRVEQPDTEQEFSLPRHHA